jgi:hypothetical protein
VSSIWRVSGAWRGPPRGAQDDADEMASAGRAPAPADGDSNVVAFPTQPSPTIERPDRAADADLELAQACDGLVDNFRVVHQSMKEFLQSSHDPGATAADGETSELLLSLAALSTSTKRFQQQLEVTIDAMFR